LKDFSYTQTRNNKIVMKKKITKNKSNNASKDD